MELKFIFAIDVKIFCLFQSYLYGIEMQEAFRKVEQISGFNRTFMELKSL